MRIVGWLSEATWQATVQTCVRHAGAGAHITLLHVADVRAEEAARGAFAGLLGRSAGDADPGERISAFAAAEERDLLVAAERYADELLATAAPSPGVRPIIATSARRGRVEREVVAAADGVDLLVACRDGETQRLGPKSLGKHTRFVVDHAPCAILLIWPAGAPAIDSIPPPH